MKNLLLFCLVFSFVCGFSQNNDWTLDKCIEYAIKNNIRVKQTELDLKAANVNLAISKGSFLPSISADVRHAWIISDRPDMVSGLLKSSTQQSSSLGVSVGLDIYKGFENQRRLQQARLESLVASYSSQKMKEDIALHVINAYLQILFNKELVKTNIHQKAYDLKQVERTVSLVDAGVVPSGDLLETEANLALSQQRVLVSENDLVMSKLNLAQLLQIKEYEDFDIADLEYDVVSYDVLLHSPGEIARRAKEVLTNIKIAEASLEVAESKVRSSKSAYQPTLRFFYSLGSSINYDDRVVGSYADGSFKTIGFVEGSNESVIQASFVPMIGKASSFSKQFQDNLNSNFGLSLAIPIFNGLRVRNNVKLSKLALEQKVNEKELATLDLEQVVYRAYTDANNALQVYEASKKSLESRVQSLEYARDRYEVGLINIFDLNQNQNIYVQAQSSLLQAKYDYIFKARVLEYYYGKSLF